MSPVQDQNAHQSPTALPDMARGKGKHTGLQTLPPSLCCTHQVHPLQWLLLNRTAAAALQGNRDTQLTQRGRDHVGFSHQKVLKTSCACAHVMAMNTSHEHAQQVPLHTSPAHSALPSPTVCSGWCLHDQGGGCLELDKSHTFCSWSCVSFWWRTSCGQPLWQDRCQQQSNRAAAAHTGQHQLQG